MPHEDIELPVAGTVTRKARLTRPDPTRANRRGVVVIHDLTGFRQDTLRHCERFADEGYVALAPDLFAGGRPGCVVATIRSMTSQKGEAFTVIDAARQHLAADPEVDEDKLAVIGFCMGGGFALVAAADQAFAVAAPFYGSVPREARRLQGTCPLIAQYGARDTAFASHARRLAAHLTELEVPHEVVMHEGVGHSFMNDHRDVFFAISRYLPPLHAGYDATTEADAWSRVLAFFDAHLA
ncbi:MAG: dienelactone hydrolase family protein [Myxococcota bacterium]